MGALFPARLVVDLPNWVGDQVMAMFAEHMGIRVIRVDAEQRFLAALTGEALYYFGLPVVNGDVRWRVPREQI